MTLPPSSGGIGIMLKTASSTLICSAALNRDATGTDTFASPIVMGDTGSTRSTTAAIVASTRLLAGPAAATNT